MFDRMNIYDFTILLKICGIFPMSITKCILLWSLTLIPLLTLLFAFTAFKDYDEFSEGVASIATFFQASCKIAVILIYGKQVNKIINDINNLWSWDKYGTDIEKIIKEAQTFTRKFYKFYTIFTIFSIECFNLRKIIFHEPFAMFTGAFCNLNDFYCYWFYIIIGHAVGPLLVVSINGFDGLFFGTILYCYCEFKQIKYALKQLNNNKNPKENFQEFCKIVQHHTDVLKIIENLNEILGFALINQFLSSVATICFELFILSVSNGDIVNIIDKVLIIICYLGELGVYCYAGSIIYHESLMVAHYYYDLDWYKEDKKKISKSLVQPIQRSQKPCNISVGGFNNLNLETFTQVVRLCMSVWTFLQAIFVSE